jgi:hypothetical protein
MFSVGSEGVTNRGIQPACKTRGEYFTKKPINFSRAIIFKCKKSSRKMLREIQHISRKGFPSVKHFPFGKHFLAGKRFPVGKCFPVDKCFPLGMHFPVGKQFSCGQQYGKTFPRDIKTRKLSQKAIFWNYVKYSPLCKTAICNDQPGMSLERGPRCHDTSEGIQPWDWTEGNTGEVQED